MKLSCKYCVHGYSGGMMLSNTIDCDWNDDLLIPGNKLDNPNSEVKITVLNKTNNAVTINIIYRKKEETLNISSVKEEYFKDDANAYGFSYSFIIKE